MDSSTRSLRTLQTLTGSHFLVIEVLALQNRLRATIGFPDNRRGRGEATFLALRGCSEKTLQISYLWARDALLWRRLAVLRSSSRF